MRASPATSRGKRNNMKGYDDAEEKGEDVPAQTPNQTKAATPKSTGKMKGRMGKAGKGGK